MMGKFQDTTWTIVAWNCRKRGKNFKTVPGITPWSNSREMSDKKVTHQFRLAGLSCLAVMLEGAGRRAAAQLETRKNGRDQLRRRANWDIRNRHAGVLRRPSPILIGCLVIQKDSAPGRTGLTMLVLGAENPIVTSLSISGGLDERNYCPFVGDYPID